MANIDKIKLNGTSYTIVDSAVPSWAKQSSKPSYTASEVGAYTETQVNNLLANKEDKVVSLDISFGQAITTDGVATSEYNKIVSAVAEESKPLLRDADGSILHVVAGDNTGEYKLMGFDDYGYVRIVTIGPGVMGSDYEVLDVQSMPIEQFTESDPTVPSYVKSITQANITSWNGKQAALVSGTNIKTINSTSLLGSGNIALQTPLTFDDAPTANSNNPVKSSGIKAALDAKKGIADITAPATPNGTFVVSLDNGDDITVDFNHTHSQYQEALVSGTTIKTLNNESLLGSGDIEITSGVDGVGITSIVKTGTGGLVDTYTITYTDGGTDTFTVTNGAQGNSGYTGAANELEVVNNLTQGGATAALSAEMGKTLNTNFGTRTGYTQSEFTWVANRKITHEGKTVTDNTCKSTEPFSVKAGSKIHATGTGANIGVISRYNEGASNLNAYTPLAVMNSNTSQEYVVTVQQDMQVAICGLKSGGGAISAYVEHAGTIYEDVLTPYNAKLYTREDLLASMSGQPIKMNVGDIACVVNPLINNDVVKQVNSEGTSIKVLWRPTTSHGYDMFKYEKTATDGIDYISILIGNSSVFTYAYILRRKPAVNVLSDEAFYADYITFDDAGCDITNVGYCISKDGSVVSESTARHRVFTFENKGYKSVYAKSVSSGADNYRIAFYSGEPSAETFLPIYSKHFWEHESAYDSGPYEYTAIVPDNAKYIKICMRINAQSNDLRLYKTIVIPQVNDIRDTFERCYAEHLLPMAYQHNSPEYLENGHFTNYKKVDLKCIFYTDLHSYYENLNRIMMLGDYLYDKGVLDCIISGGDNLQDGAESYDLFNHTVSQSKAENLVAVGNHDASTRWNATKQSAYENNIAPMLSRVSDVVAPEDSATAYRLYYYKDYNKVRVIVLYTPPTNDNAFADDSQLTWLQTVLADAKTNSKHVLIVNHHYYNTAYKWSYSSLGEFWESKPNTFLSPYGKVGSSGDTSFIFPTEFLLAVKAFEDAGGKFICWLSGHGHFDNFFDVTDHATYGYQPMFNSGSCAHKHSANEFVKKKGDKSMDLFNYICVDTNNTTIDILRIGCNIDVFGRSRKVLTYNYGAHCIMANY